MRRLIQKNWFWVGLAVLLGGATSSLLVFLLATIFVMKVEMIYDRSSLVLLIVLSTVICTFVLASRFFTQNKIKGFRFGLLYGALAAFSSHVLGSILIGVPLFLKDSSFLDIGVNLVALLFLVLTYSLILVGWISIPIGAFVGAVLGWLYDRKHPISETSVLNEALVELNMRQLMQKDWFWVGGATLIATISALLAVWIGLGLTLDDDLGDILSLCFSVILGTAISAGFFGWLLFTRTRSGHKAVIALIYGGLASLCAHLVSSIFSSMTFTRSEDFLGFEVGFFNYIFLATIFGIFGLRGFSIFWGAFIGALLGWLYDRTHPTPENQKASLSD